MKLRSFKYKLGSSSKINFNTEPQIEHQYKFRPIFTQHQVNYQDHKLRTEHIINSEDKKYFDFQKYKPNFSKFKEKGVSMHTGSTLDKQNRTSIFLIKKRSNSKFNTILKKNIVESATVQKYVGSIQVKCQDTILQSDNLLFQITQAQTSLTQIQKQLKQTLKLMQKCSKQMIEIKDRILNEIQDLKQKSQNKIKFLWKQLQKNKTNKCGMVVNWRQTVSKQKIKQNKQKELLQQVQFSIQKIQKIVNFK